MVPKRPEASALTSPAGPGRAGLCLRPGTCPAFCALDCVSVAPGFCPVARLLTRKDDAYVLDPTGKASQPQDEEDKSETGLYAQDG